MQSILRELETDVHDKDQSRFIRAERDQRSRPLRTPESQRGPWQNAHNFSNWRQAAKKQSASMVYFTVHCRFADLLFQAGASSVDASSSAVILITLDGKDGATNIASCIGRAA